MKKRSTIGYILQGWAVLNLIFGGVGILYILSQPDFTRSVPVALVFGVFVGFGVLVLLGIAELLHAVMRTAAATEEASETLREQAMHTIRDSIRQDRPMTRPPAVGKVSSLVAAEFESEPWQAPGETKCEVCNNFFTLPSKRQAEVTCPHCGVSAAWPS